MKSGGDGSKDRLAWSWTQGASTSQPEFADPTSGTDYALCIFAGASPQLIGQAVIPASGSAWRATGTTGYRYKDAGATAAGVTKVTLKGSAVNKSKVQVTGKGVGLPDLPLPGDRSGDRPARERGKRALLGRALQRPGGHQERARCQLKAKSP